MTDTIQVSQITVSDRLRKEYGDIEQLAENIAQYGLIQPIVLEQTTTITADGSQPPYDSYTLLAGGRRFAALSLLGITELHHGVTSDPNRFGFVFSSELASDDRRLIELYENIHRKQMTWQEDVLAVREIHLIKVKEKALEGEDWILSETGRLLGFSKSKATYSLRLAELILAKDEEVMACSNVLEAFQKVIVGRAQKNLASRIALEQSTKIVAPAPLQLPGIGPITGVERQPPIDVPLGEYLRQGKMEDLLNGVQEAFDHVVTDWPYAIDMSMLQQTNMGMDVTSVAAEHDVAQNLADFAKWMQTMFNVIKPGGFCVIFCDQEHWHYQKKLALSVGFAVQRWPLTWVKTHPCQNGSAQYNFTKTTEIAMVMRKGNATIIDQSKSSKSHWLGDNLVARKQYGHPFAKPAGLWTWIFEAIAARGQSYLDPFAGRGSSVLPAISFGLVPYAIELSDEHYPHLVNQVRSHYMTVTANNVNFV